MISSLLFPRFLKQSHLVVQLLGSYFIYVKKTKSYPTWTGKELCLRSKSKFLFSCGITGSYIPLVDKYDIATILM